MPVSNNITGFDYVRLAQGAKAIPVQPQGGPGGFLELPPLLETPLVDVSEHLNERTDPDKPGVETAYNAYTRTFVTWRPWESCERCATALDSGHATLPALEGDYECPHTQKAAYLALLNKALAGDCIISTKEVFHASPPLQARYVCVEWMEVDAAALAKVKAAKKDRVYPPDRAAAFAKK